MKNVAWHVKFKKILSAHIKNGTAINVCCVIILNVILKEKFYNKEKNWIYILDKNFESVYF